MVKDDIVNVYTDPELKEHSLFASKPFIRDPKIEISNIDKSLDSLKPIEVLKKGKSAKKNQRALSPDYEDEDVPEEVTIINDTKMFKKNDSMIHNDPKKTKSVIKFRGNES